MTPEEDQEERKRGPGRLRGFIKKPQVLGPKGSRDSVEALLSRVDIDPALPARLAAGARDVRAGVESANGLFKLEILQDLTAEASSGEVRKRFAALAVKTADKQLMDYKRVLGDFEKKHSELDGAAQKAWDTLQEEHAPILKFLAKHAPEDPEVARVGEALRKFTAEMEEARRELDGVGGLIGASKAKERALEKLLEKTSKGLR